MARAPRPADPVRPAIRLRSAAGLTEAIEQVARHRGLPESCLSALLELTELMAMGDLGRRMRCDPSFVTIIADMMEKRGLARAWLGDVFHDGVAARADPLIGQWKRETAQEEEE